MNDEGNPEDTAAMKYQSFISFNYIVSACQDRRRHFQPKCLGGVKIEDHLELARLYDRKFGRVCAIQNLANITAELPVCFGGISVIAH
jgi:hypothetical protein